MANDIRKKFSGIQLQLWDAIQADGRTYYALAAAAGVKPEILYRFRDRDRDLTLATAAKIAAALGLELRKAR